MPYGSIRSVCGAASVADQMVEVADYTRAIGYNLVTVLLQVQPVRGLFAFMGRIPQGAYPDARIVGNLANPGQIVWVRVPSIGSDFQAIVSSPITRADGLTVLVDGQGTCRVYGPEVPRTLDRTTDFYWRRSQQKPKQRKVEGWLYLLIRHYTLIEIPQPPGTPDPGSPALRCRIWVHDPLGTYTNPPLTQRYVRYGGTAFLPAAEQDVFGQPPPANTVLDFSEGSPYPAGTFTRFGSGGAQLPTITYYSLDGDPIPTLPARIYQNSVVAEDPGVPAVWRLMENIEITPERPPNPGAQAPPDYEIEESYEYFIYGSSGQLIPLPLPPEAAFITPLISVERTATYLDLIYYQFPPGIYINTHYRIDSDGLETLPTSESWRRSAFTGFTGEPVHPCVTFYREFGGVNLDPIGQKMFEYPSWRSLDLSNPDVMQATLDTYQYQDEEGTCSRILGSPQIISFPALPLDQINLGGATLPWGLEYRDHVIVGSVSAFIGEL